ncbi:MAG: hypothetical protein ACAI44_37540 [Candidatus Sericytochromatia bacterium]
MTLYQKYGCQALVQQLIEQLYPKFMADSELGPCFKNKDWQEVVRHQVALLTMLLDGPRVLPDLELVRTYRRFGLQDRGFDALAWHLRISLAETGMEREEQEVVLGKLAEMRSDVVQAGLPAGGELECFQHMIQQATVDMQQATRELIHARETLLDQKEQEIRTLRGQIQQLTRGRSLQAALLAQDRINEIIAALAQEAGQIPSHEVRALLEELGELALRKSPWS